MLVVEFLYIFQARQTWEALIYLGMMSEVKDMKSHILQALGIIPN